jgi:hypothetical protein
MAYRMIRDENRDRPPGASLAGPLFKPRWGRACAFVAVMAALSGGAQSNPPTGGPVRFDKTDLPTAINQPPDPNAQMEQQNQQTAQKSFAAANTERRKQIADDSARLLKLATDLKSEVDKTTKDTLSLSVIRKAGEIEKLAHDVKEKMKLTAAGN